MVLIAILVGAGLGVLLPSVILKAIGFSTAGVLAGSIAAWFHSIIGNVIAGSIFAILQSIGATGFSAAATALFATIGSVVGAITWLISQAGLLPIIAIKVFTYAGVAVYSIVELILSMAGLLPIIAIKVFTYAGVAVYYIVEGILSMVLSLTGYE